MSTRERLIDAAARIIRERGLNALTTRDVAQEAGVAEGTIYRHFQDKEDLLLRVLSERLPGHFLALISDFPDRAGSGEVAANLAELATSAVAFFVEQAPFTSALGADPDLAKHHYARLRELGTGPWAAQLAAETYLREEQRLGRVHAGVDPAAAAYLLLGICFNYAHSRYVGAHPTRFSAEEFVGETVRVLMTGLAPAREPAPSDPGR